MATAQIDIVQTDHIHTATVRSCEQLKDYCLGLARSGKSFRIGSIYSYGNLDINELTNTLNQVQRYSAYDRTLNK